METMKAGRELDALVAEQVMGWKDIRFGDEMTAGGVTGFAKPPGDGFRMAFPHYSTDIAAAFEVWDSMRGRGVTWWADGLLGPQFDKWIFYRNDMENIPIAEGDTAPHAICLAALKAVS